MKHTCMQLSTIFCVQFQEGPRAEDGSAAGQAVLPGLSLGLCRTADPSTSSAYSKEMPSGPQEAGEEHTTKALKGVRAEHPIHR